MDLPIFFETLLTCWPIIFLAMAVTCFGNLWIEYLYNKALLRNSLSFPNQIDSRAKWRKPLLFVFLLLCYGQAWILTTMPALLYILVAISFLLFMTVTDFEQQVILNEMIFLFAVAGLCYTLHLRLSVQEHALAAVGGGLLFLFLAFISRGAVGGGDIKLIAALGLWLGKNAALSVLIYGSIAGGVAALLLLAFHRTKRNQYIAYGPYFAVSGIGIMLKLLKVLF